MRMPVYNRFGMSILSMQLIDNTKSYNNINICTGFICDYSAMVFPIEYTEQRWSCSRCPRWIELYVQV